MLAYLFDLLTDLLKLFIRDLGEKRCGFLYFKREL